jgi:glycine cleavage system regulatory protein
METKQSYKFMKRVYNLYNRKINKAGYPMKKTVICSFISNDKTGIVELLAKAISDCSGNWLESSMAKLAGHFAGIIRIDIDELKEDELRSALNHLTKSGLSIQLDLQNNESENPSSNESSSGSVAKHVIQLNVVGNDRPGIVYEISQALVAAKINVVNMQTHLSSAPMSGDSLFHSTMSLTNESEQDLDSLELQLEKIAERLSIEIDLDVQEK